MHFVWFWTFWHWSKESFRSGSLLREPLHGIASHWDEWFRHDASSADLSCIEDCGRTVKQQRLFMAWLFRHWAPEAGYPRNRMAPKFVLAQLANLPPFQRWEAFAPYRSSYCLGGIPAVVLSQNSLGVSEDVRVLEAVALPADPGSPPVVPEGFKPDGMELDAARKAVKSQLTGKGLVVFLTLWLLGGTRPYRKSVKLILAVAWITVLGLMLRLLFGPEPGEYLYALAMTLFCLWTGVVVLTVIPAAWEAVRAWREGHRLERRLDQLQIRLRMNGGLVLKGGSAGLPFSLNILLALARADRTSSAHSWLWSRLLASLQLATGSWAATGIIAPEGSLKPVVIEPKLRACLLHPEVRHIITPAQTDARQAHIERLSQATVSQVNEPVAHPAGVRFGFAAAIEPLRSHRCRHVAQALLRIGGFRSVVQVALNLLACGISLFMLLGLPSLLSIIAPPAVPMVVAPSSPSPYNLWVSLATKRPDCFEVVLESNFWANRRSDVTLRAGLNPSTRAEIWLSRLPGHPSFDPEDGVVWVERRYRFLNRTFAPGERIGRSTLTYLNHLSHD